MKSDKTYPQSSASSKTASGKPFSNQLLKTQTMSLKEEKTQQKTDASQKSLIEDKTSTSESTAHGAAPPIEYAPAPTRHEPKVAAKAPRQIPSKPAPTLTAPAPVASNHPIQPPKAFFEDSYISPTLTEGEEQQQLQKHVQKASASTGGKGSNEELLKKFKKNIYQIQEDQSQQFSWIRKLSTRKWFTFFDTVLAGFTLLFFSTAFYLIFHINPTLEYKLTPEFQLKIRPFTVKDSFQRCNHSFWIRTNDSILPSINFIQCYRNFQSGRLFVETFKSPTPHSLGVCNLDRAEIHQCYDEGLLKTNNSLNIYWGGNDGGYNGFICNGSVADKVFGGTSVTKTLYSLNPPIQKYAMLDNITSFLNQTISSTAFFFQCPKCVVMYRTNGEHHRYKHNYNYTILEIATSIPPESRTCLDMIHTGYKGDVESSRLLRLAPKFFSHLVFPFEIVEDAEFLE